VLSLSFDDIVNPGPLLQHVGSVGQSQLGIQFVGKPWDHLRSVPVDRAGEHIFSLRPRMEKYVDRLAVEVKVEDNVKVVTLRSTYKIENSTLYPLELLLIDESNHPVDSVHKIGG
jgi:vacuolar protein sorting-associated protein 13A/C